MSLREKINKVLRKQFLAGVLVIVPLIITYMVLRFLFLKIDGLLSPLIAKFVGYHIPGLGVVATIILIFLAGFLTTNVVGSKLFRIAERFLVGTPVIRTVYVSAKQLVEAVNLPEKKAFKEVVLVEYPLKGAYALGFVTSGFDTSFKKEGDPLVVVFIPSTPTPFTGIVILYHRSDIIPLDMTVEDGIKYFVSGGIASPDKLPLKDKAS